MSNTACDIYIVGVGGQGVLTISDIITGIAFKKDIPVNYYPTKGMAQRGGFVKAQLRLGHIAAPVISQQSADIVVSMELSESLKAVKYLTDGGNFVLFASKWEPTAVMLKKADYPSLEAVTGEIKKAGGVITCADESALPQFEGKPVRSNIFVLGMLLNNPKIKEIISEDDVIEELEARWPKAAKLNTFTLKAGIQAGVK